MREQVKYVNKSIQNKERSFSWKNTPQYQGYNNALSFTFSVGNYAASGNTFGTEKNRAVTEKIVFNLQSFRLINLNNSVYKFGLLTFDSDGNKINNASNNTGYTTDSSFDYVITSGKGVTQIGFQIAKIDDSNITNDDLHELQNSIYMMYGKFEIPFNQRSHEEGFAYLFTPYPIYVDTESKSLSINGSFAVCCGKMYFTLVDNGIKINISNFDVSLQGVFLFQLSIKTIKWMVRSDFAGLSDDETKDYIVIGQSWAYNDIFGNYIHFYTNTDIYVNNELQKTSWLTGKFANRKFLFDGDSIMYGTSGNKRASIPIATEIAKKLNILYYDNISVPGACICPKNTKDGKSMVERCQSIKYENYTDYVFNGLTNDYGFGRKIGSIDDTDTGTVYGAYNKILSTIFSKNPNAHILLITPLFRSYVNTNDGTIEGNAYNIPNEIGVTLNEYCDAAVNIGKKYNIPVYDSRLNSPVNILNYKSTLVKDSDIKYLHPTEETYIEYGDRIAEYIDKIF